MGDSPARADYDHGLLELERYFAEGDETALSSAIKALKSAAASSPGDARVLAALGYSLDAANDADSALVALRNAARADPANRAVDALILKILAESGMDGEPMEREAMEAIEQSAVRQGVHLESLRAELRAAAMPTDAHTLVLNAFVHGRNFLRSWIGDEIDRVHREKNPGARRRERELEAREIEEQQEALRREVDALRVPESFRELTPWACRLGLGDDVLRPKAFGALSTKDRSQVRRAVAAHANEVHSWLDTFGATTMPPEVGAFLYLMLGIEEMA